MIVWNALHLDPNSDFHKGGCHSHGTHGRKALLLIIHAGWPLSDRGVATEPGRLQHVAGARVLRFFDFDFLTKHFQACGLQEFANRKHDSYS